MQEDLVTKLDGLLERYLGLLDQYQQAREQLAKDLSSGYLSLARANAASAGRAHYGRDYYDERMQASRRIRLTETEEESIKAEVVEVQEAIASSGSDSNNKSNTSAASAHASSDTYEQKQKQPSKQVGGMTIGPLEESDSENELEKAFIALQLSKGAAKSAATQDQPETESAEQETHEGSESKTFDTKHNNKETDKGNHYNPIQMFGFFVPTTLRQAQASFVEVVVKSVPALVELNSEMSLLEIEIRRTRKAIARGNR